MKLDLTIEYYTQWGEELRITGSIPLLGNFNEKKAIPLSSEDGKTWKLEVETDSIHDNVISYKYILFKDGKICRREPSNIAHTIELIKYKAIALIDRWYDEPTALIEAYPIYNQVWSNSIDNLQDSSSKSSQRGKFLILKAHFAQLQANEQLAIIGNQKELGYWSCDQSHKLELENGIAAITELPITKIKFPLEYKYIIIDKETQEIKYWENGPNRVLEEHANLHDISVMIDDGYLNFPNRKGWKGSGVAIPIFSLRSKNSYGIGEFTDLKLLVDWASQVGMKIIQILPINDTTSSYGWGDSYPYRCISVFALNPIYIDLIKLGILNTSEADRYRKEQTELNQLTSIDFPTVQNRKLNYLEYLYKLKFIEVINSSTYIEFYNTNKEWLLPYSAYLYFRKLYGTDDINNWGNDNVFSVKRVKELMKDDDILEQLQFHFYVQYSLHQQLKEATDYAISKHVAIKGDLPIGISKKSVDAWQYPKLFNMSNQAGAPPDAFAMLGQNWGFPTYNWNEMAKDSYLWWQQRLQQMERYYKAYRIDHILGFFRIWSIPLTAIDGTLGQFDPALPLSTDEMKSWGFYFDEKQIRPNLDKEYIETYFTNEELTILKEIFFIDNGDDTYRIKEEYNTQVRLKESRIFSDANFERKVLNLYSNILFIPDYKNKDLYHPRIDGVKTEQFERLSEEQKRAYLCIYNDFFYNRHNSYWKDKAYQKLPALIRASNMLVCGEDLGMIPNSVPEVMNNLSILSLEVRRMPKESNKCIGNPQDYPYFSVSTFSTHDMATLRGWWKNNPELREKLLDQIGYSNDNNISLEISTEDAKAVIDSELKGNSVLCIEAIQDWLSLSKNYRQLSTEEEQINIPSDIHHKWSYRLPCKVEDLINDDELNNIIIKLIGETNR